MLYNSKTKTLKKCRVCSMFHFDKTSLIPLQDNNKKKHHTPNRLSKQTNGNITSSKRPTPDSLSSKRTVSSSGKAWLRPQKSSPNGQRHLAARVHQQSSAPFRSACMQRHHRRHHEHHHNHHQSGPRFEQFRYGILHFFFAPDLKASGKHGRLLRTAGTGTVSFHPNQPAESVLLLRSLQHAHPSHSQFFVVVVVVGQDTRALLEGDFIGRCEFYNRRFKAENRQCVCLRVFNGQSVG